jgi:signal peptidase I
MKTHDKKEVSVNELFPLVREVINHGHKARFTVSGSSMYPWIIDNRDQVLLTRSNKLKNGDIILYQNSRGKYILHRIMKKEGNGYQTMGDSCVTADEELITPREVIGVVQKIYRNGKEIDCTSAFWQFIFLLWRVLLPFRNEILKLYHTMARIRFEAGKRKSGLGA